MNHITSAEIRGDRQGKVGAVVGLILFILLLVIPVFFTTLPKPGQPGILVNLGMIDVGQGEENAPIAAAEPTPTPPREVEPTPVTPPPPPPPPQVSKPEPVPVQRDVVVSETPQEIAIRKEKAREEARKKAEADRKKQEQDRINKQKETERNQREAEAREQRRQQELENERIRKAQAEEAARKQAAAAAEAKRQAELQAARDRVSGALGGGSGSGRGNTGQSGNQGVDNGDPNAGRLEGISTSDGRVSGGLGGRGVLSSPLVKENTQKTGVVVVYVCVGPDGRVVSAERQQNGTTTTDAQLLRSAEQNAATWRFKADPAAPARQCGQITYNFKVQ